MINIFLQIKDTNFFQADRLSGIDEMSKRSRPDNPLLDFRIVITSLLKVALKRKPDGKFKR